MCDICRGNGGGLKGTFALAAVISRKPLLWRSDRRESILKTIVGVKQESRCLSILNLEFMVKNTGCSPDSLHKPPRLLGGMRIEKVLPLPAYRG